MAKSLVYSRKKIARAKHEVSYVRREKQNGNAAVAWWPGGRRGTCPPPATWEDGGAEGAKRFEGAHNARKPDSH